MGSPTISCEAIDACVEVAQNAVYEGATTPVDPNYVTRLHCLLALTTETPHTGTKIMIQSSGVETGNRNWTTFEFVRLVGTANSQVITNDPATVGTTVFTVADTTGYEDNGVRKVFLEDVNTFANSEWFELVSAASNTSLTVLDGSAIEHAVNSIFYNVAEDFEYDLPLGHDRFRVIVDNTYDDDGSTVAYQLDVTKVTGV